MGDWVEVTKKIKKEPEKKTQFSSIRNNTQQSNIIANSGISSSKNTNNIKKLKLDTKKYNEKDLNLIFEDTFDQYINEEFSNLFKYVRPNSDLLKNVYPSEVIDFFYNYIDIESSVKTSADFEEVKNEYYSDDEYF
tara:strand:- start:26023 stop:26430 length:408 start_codon:yes stop_codon:yes gene_type:complete